MKVLILFSWWLLLTVILIGSIAWLYTLTKILWGAYKIISMSTGVVI